MPPVTEPTHKERMFARAYSEANGLETPGDDAILIIRDSQLVGMIENLMPLLVAIPAKDALPILHEITALFDKCPAYELRDFIDKYGDYFKWRREALERFLNRRNKEKSVKGTARARSVSMKRRFAILERDRFTCQYCGRKAPDVELHVDHIFPFSRGGESNETNLITSCKECNFGKNDKCLIPQNVNGCAPSIELEEKHGQSQLDEQDIPLKP